MFTFLVCVTAMFFFIRSLRLTARLHLWYRLSTHYRITKNDPMRALSVSQIPGWVRIFAGRVHCRVYCNCLYDGVPQNLANLILDREDMLPYRDPTNATR